ncbi:hypothetical protein CFAL_11955 (plasmid) [Corynebacterium falsenii DSM 44353]|uniref:hypothetical protein n=1 Tax=Corynebacterium falsenii TaxID=108486 RepID=UPI0003E92E51|nr:hypothetical protein [Corynebacterium falsenii]AHI04388.1 hypothetical protein CFAL_09770 [Corynebacterium falsenii DSM 44353]AHI04468.1 hypothetical protein CFAL_11955 [Corynebacterium falsenii DSM 44353]UBI04598.1 hypothetical protein LA343_11605 [Corynebacterium falsenii]
MTTNYQRALDLADHIAAVDESPRELVKQLHDLRLLMPDDPEPRDTGDFVEWHIPGHDLVVWTQRGASRIMIQRIEPGDLTAQQAYQLAKALLLAIKAMYGEIE